MTDNGPAMMWTVPESTHASFRVPPEKRRAAQAKAKRHGEDVTNSVVMPAIDNYIAPQLVPGDTVYLSGLEHGHDGLYVIEEGPNHGGVGADTVTLRRVDQ